MDQTQLNELLDRYHKGTASANETKLLEYWFAQHSDLTRWETYPEDYPRVHLEMWEEVSHSVRQGNIKENYKSTILGKRRSWWQWPAAAVLLLGLGMGWFLLNKKDVPDSQWNAATDIAPGIQGATLTLADGRKLDLSGAANGKLAEEAGMVISKTADGQVVYEAVGAGNSTGSNTLATNRGETYMLRLPDGTKVWLNAASSITYPISFDGKSERRVALRGEGYFEVAKQDGKPFLVSSSAQEIQVLGTHFNVDAYKDKVRTTLLEGKVQVKLSDGNGTALLKPGEQSLAGLRGISVSEVDVEDAVAWKEGYLLFEGETLEDIMEKVSRWYDIEVVYSDKNIRERRYYGSVSRSVKLSEVLRRLEKVQPVSFVLKGRRVTVSARKTN